MRATSQVECGERGHQGCHHNNLKVSSFPLPDAQTLVVLSHEGTWALNPELKYARKTCEKQEGQEYPEERVHCHCTALSKRVKHRERILVFTTLKVSFTVCGNPKPA